MGIHRFYRKTHLGGKEAGWFRAGDRLPVFETAQGVIGMAVCYDTHYPALVETLSLKGAELVLLLSPLRRIPCAEKRG